MIYARGLIMLATRSVVAIGTIWTDSKGDQSGNESI